MNSIFGINTKNQSTVKGYKLFLYFLFIIAIAQFFFDYSKPLSIVFLLISFLFIVVVSVLASRIELFYFMFFVILMNVLIPGTNDRTFSQVVPFLFSIIILVKSAFHLPRMKVDLIRICLYLYFLILLITVIRGIDINSLLPGGKSGNTGLLARWNLLNTFFVFVATMLSFQAESLHDILENLYKLFLAVLVVSLIIFYFNITFKLPLFNTFSWSVILEGNGSKRMGVAGIAAIYVFIYFLCFKVKKQLVWIVLVLVILGVIASGGRSTMLAFLLVIYCGWIIGKRILMRSFVLSVVAAFLFLIFSISPLVLYIPQKFQRLFIIFPKEFYSGSLSELESTAAANSSTFRYTMWGKAIPEIIESPIVGSGFAIPKQTYSFSKDGLSSVQSKSYDMIYFDFMAGGQLHNTYVSIAYIMGIPALLLFLIGFISLIIKTYKSFLVHYASEYGGYLKFLLLILFSGLLSSVLGDLHFDLVFFIFFAITLRTLSHLKEESKMDRLHANLLIGFKNIPSI